MDGWMDGNTVKQGLGLVQMKFNMITLCLDNHRQSFWHLINRWIQYVLAYLSH